MVADSYHFDKQQDLDPDPHQTNNSDPNPESHQCETSDPYPNQSEKNLFNFSDFFIIIFVYD